MEDILEKAIFDELRCIDILLEETPNDDTLALKKGMLISILMSKYSYDYIIRRLK